MKKYPLGFAIIEWSSGGYSEAIIYQNGKGDQLFSCANWINNNNCYIETWENCGEIANIITDFNDINIFFDNQHNHEDDI